MATKKIESLQDIKAAASTTAAAEAKVVRKANKDKQGRAYATVISAGSDGTGAQRQIDRIATGWRLRR